jgi:hypothetical protein
MTELLRAAPDTDAPLAQDCLRLMAALLRACTGYQCAPAPGPLTYAVRSPLCVRACCMGRVRGPAVLPLGPGRHTLRLWLGMWTCFSSM